MRRPHCCTFFTRWTHCCTFFTRWTHSCTFFTRWAHCCTLFTRWAHWCTFFTRWAHWCINGELVSSHQLCTGEGEWVVPWWGCMRLHETGCMRQMGAWTKGAWDRCSMRVHWWGCICLALVRVNKWCTFEGASVLHFVRGFMRGALVRVHQWCTGEGAWVVHWWGCISGALVTEHQWCSGDDASMVHFWGCTTLSSSPPHHPLIDAIHKFFSKLSGNWNSI